MSPLRRLERLLWRFRGPIPAACYWCIRQWYRVKLARDRG